MILLKKWKNTKCNRGKEMIISLLAMLFVAYFNDGGAPFIPFILFGILETIIYITLF